MRRIACLLPLLLVACSAAPQRQQAAIDAPLSFAAPATYCRVDADCTVKNVGNCCGYYPACVNVNAEVSPEKVAEQCQRNGMMGVCGFPAISACTCVAGQCQARDNRIRLP